MAQPDTPMLVAKKSQDGILQFYKSCMDTQSKHWNLREQMRKIDLAYIREKDNTKEHKRAKIANTVGDSSKFQNITVPIVLPQVEAAVTYQASVFLTGTPLFGVVSNPLMADEAIQMETVIDDQAVRGGWVREFLMFFRDGFKYNLSALEVSWERTTTAALETDLSFSTKQARPKQIIWEGNAVKRRDPYNIIFDARVPLTEVYQKGDFAGYVELMSRIQLKSFINALPEKMVDNIKPAFESSLGFSGIASTGEPYYYIPQINPDAFIDPVNMNQVNWVEWASLSGAEQKIQYKDMYQVATLYARIIPVDFNLRVPAQNTPQVWKFIIVNNSVLIYAERLTNAHGWLPMLFGQPLEDGLGFQTKSLGTNVTPIQDITSAMWNSVIAARRRAISDRGVYDPSKISEAHINSDNPSAKIPVRPSAYGKPVSEAYSPIPFRDDQSGLILQETQQIIGMANHISGQNPVRQGQFVKGNKTLQEFSSVMSNANGRDQVTALLYESQIFTPLKTILKVNILQYQGGVSLFNRERQKKVDIDPIKLRKAILEFKLSDGLIPSEKLINADTLKIGLQVIGSSPQISSQYNIGPLFSYLLKSQGGKINDFEKSQEQVAYEQAIASWQAQVAGLQELAKELLKKAPVTSIEEALKFMDELNTKIPPQPLPEQFGYTPANQGTSGGPAPVQQANRISNITNNITNTEQ